MSTDASAFSLHYTAAGGVLSTAPLTSRPLIIGSAPEADFEIRSPFVSHRHLEVELRGDAIYIVDLGSRNGTVLNGRKLPANQPMLWRPGESLSLGDVQVELSGPGVLPSANTPDAFIDPVKLTVVPTVLYPDKLVTLTLNYAGNQECKFYLEGHTLTDGLDISVFPREVLAKPGVTASTQARIKPTKRFWLGGTFPIRFTAFTTDGLYASIEARVKLRRRYEALLLLLLLIPTGVVGAFLLTPKTVPPLPTSTVTLTATSTFTEMPTAAPTSTSTTVPPTVTDLPKITLTLPDTVAGINLCDRFVRQQGWQYYIVQPNDTLFKLAGGNTTQVQQVNAIPNPGFIAVGQKICLPALPTPTPTLIPTLTPQPRITADSTCRQWTDAASITFTLTNLGDPMPNPDSFTITLASGGVLYPNSSFELATGQRLSVEVDALDATLTTQKSGITLRATCRPGPAS